MQFLEFVTFASLIALAVDVYMQGRRIKRARDSREISAWGAEIRLVAIVVILIKYSALRDGALFWGQLVLLAVFAWYISLVMKYRRGRRSR